MIKNYIYTTFSTGNELYREKISLTGIEQANIVLGNIY